MARLARRSARLAAAAAGASLFAAFAGPAQAAMAATSPASCSPQAYAYAGLLSNEPAQGIAAVVTALSLSTVTNGHVAGWIGVGGASSGPEGQADWIQAGIDTQAGLDSELYAEIAAPGEPIRYLTLAAGIEPGTAYRLAVQQIPGGNERWQVLVNGVPSTAPVYLPASNGFEPMAMGESWNGGAATCNGFSYRFGQVQITRAGSWRPLTDVSPVSDRGYTLSDLTRGGFTSSSIEP